MKYLDLFFILLAFYPLYSLADETNADKSPLAIPAQAIVGTWRFVEVDGRAVSQEFYMKYHANGVVESWPAPKAWSTKGSNISVGKYKIDETHLYLLREKREPIPARYEIDGDQLKLTNDKGPHVMAYRRLKNPPEPGQITAEQH